MIGRDSVKLPDGRQLAIETSGAPDGFPVFLLHGTPGSKTGPKPRGALLHRLGVRLICYDRPGYGGSTRAPGRAVSDAAADVAFIADRLRLHDFAVVGRSGGGPHALACAALLGGRVTRTGVLVGIAPAGAHDLDWFDGMTDENIQEYSAAEEDVAWLEQNLRRRAADGASDPESMLRFLEPQMSKTDHHVVDDLVIRGLLHENYIQAFRQGPEGWIDDALAFRRPWGFDLSSITTPVRLWHGADDRFTPVSHAHWLQRQLCHVEVEVNPHAGHFGAIEALPRMLAWLVAPARDKVPTSR